MTCQEQVDQLLCDTAEKVTVFVFIKSI